MALILGLDVGGSTTKVVGFEDGKMLEGVTVKARSYRFSLCRAWKIPGNLKPKIH